MTILVSPDGVFIKSFLKCSKLLVLLTLCITADAGYGYDIRIGVLAESGPEKCQKMWNPTAKYLSEKLPEYTFSIVPLSFDNISAAVKNEEVEFLLANPFIYLDFEVNYGISHIATLKNKLSDNYPLLGGVIFTRSDNRHIYKLRDLTGKKFVAVDPASLGGWLAALRELKKAEIDPYKDFADLRFAGNHESAIYTVLEGKADAGTANTNEFADLIRRGKIKPGDFRVIVPEWLGTSKEFPYGVSTRLYPDWPFAKLRRTPEGLATKVAIALLGMGRNNEAARAAGCYGWSYPLNYQSVHELSKELRLAGYKDFGKMSISDILHKYKTAFILVFIIFVILLIVAVLLAHLYRRTKRSEVSLIKSEKKLKDITSSLAEGIYVLNEQGSIIFMNPEAEHSLGWTFTELSGKNAHEIVHCRKADSSPLSLEECGMRNVIRTGIPFVSRDEVFVRKDGTIFPISVVCSPIMENGKVVAAVTAFRDITERKNLEEALKNNEYKYRTLLENIPERIFLKDRNSVYISCNYNYAHDLKISPSEISGMTDYDFYPEEIAEKYRADDKRIMETGEKEDIEENYILDGSEHIVHTLKTPVIDDKGNIAAILGVFRDITARKLAEAERDRLIGELQEALANVKQLSGLLPICASCKKIRNDQGYWTQIETYISEHSEALFSHAICPECGKKLYPEYYDKIWGKEDK